MPRPRNPDPYTPWKLTPPATTAGKIEHMLLDRIHGKPHYGARNKLVTALLEHWIALQEGRDPIPLPSVADLLRSPHA